MRPFTEEKSTAFLNLFLGGTGLKAGRHVRELAESDGRPFPMSLVHLDTDPKTGAFVDAAILLPLDGQKVRTIIDSPDTFGPVAKAIVEHYPHFLNPEDIQDGARTIRFLTQLAFAYYRELILGQLRNAVLQLLYHGGIARVLPVLISSSGGGTGSALQILLCQALADPRFAGRLTEGLPSGLVQTPTLFVVEPFAYALRNNNMHADKVLANAYAFRVESAWLEGMNAYKYCFHLGLANDDGAVLDSPEEIARVLGTSVYQWERHFPQFKSRAVDGPDTHAITGTYLGRDVPEIVLRRPAGQSPATGANGTPPPPPPQP